MKIAFLFAGQYRSIPNELMRKSIANLTNGIDYDIYCYSWDEVGESLDHRETIPNINGQNNSYSQISYLFSEFNLKKIQTESYNNFIINLPITYKKIFKANNYHKGTIFSLPQIYTISKCYELLESEKYKYDLIFRCRFDSIYIHPIKLYPLNKFLNSSNLYNINFGRAYYPKRVYDIFFGGSKISMSFLDQIWTTIPQLINNNFDNGQDKRDACRLIFLSAKSNNIKVKSLKTRICDVYRPFKDGQYEEYIIKSYFMSLKFDNKSLKSIPYLIKWLIYRKINLKQFFLIMLKTIFLMPISYLKRIKYF